jgi:DnaJ-class molecular chaperone
MLAAVGGDCYSADVSTEALDPYATLGLPPDCSEADIRAAYRWLVKEHHPDRQGGGALAHERIQAINAAHEILSDPARRRAYDGQRQAECEPKPGGRRSGAVVNQEVRLRWEEFIRGTELEVRVSEPGGGVEHYLLTVPRETAPGTRLLVARTGVAGGNICVRLRPHPDKRFKVRGADLCCDLRIATSRAEQGGVELLRDCLGQSLRVMIPRGVAPGTVVRVVGAGLPRARGGRGDLLVRLVYSPRITIRRAARR